MIIHNVILKTSTTLALGQFKNIKIPSLKTQLCPHPLDKRVFFKGKKE